MAGFLTEYSGFRWVIFFMAEYPAMFVVSGLGSLLFLGGWNGPVPIAFAGVGLGGDPQSVLGWGSRTRRDVQFHCQSRVWRDVHDLAPLDPAAAADRSGDDHLLKILRADRLGHVGRRHGMDLFVPRRPDTGYFLMNAINWHSCFFLLFAFVVLRIGRGGGGYRQNRLRTACWRVVSLGAVAGLFFLAVADFLGAVELMVYVGGTMVLLVFGVMLTARGPFVPMKTGGGQWIMATIIGGSLLAVLLQAALSVPDWSGAGGQAPQRPTALRLGLGLMGVRVDQLDRPQSGAQCRPQRRLAIVGPSVGVRVDFGPFGGGAGGGGVFGPGEKEGRGRFTDKSSRRKRLAVAHIYELTFAWVRASQ